MVFPFFMRLKLPKFQPIEHKHPGRPDLDYDDTPVGPGAGVECREERRPPPQNEEEWDKEQR